MGISNFNMDISSVSHSIITDLSSVSNDAPFDETFEILDSCSNVLFDIWNKNATDGTVFLNNLTTNIDDISSVEQHFIKWCDSSSISWEDLSGSSDNSIWGSINPPSGLVLLPSGDRSELLNCSGDCESSLWIDISKITILQFKSIIYELLNNNIENPEYRILPNFFYDKEEIKKMKRYIIMFYIMIKGDYANIDGVNTGL